MECVQFRTLLLLLLFFLGGGGNFKLKSDFFRLSQTILRPDPHKSTLGTSRGFASRLLRMKGLVTPWLLIATEIRIFLKLFYANRPQVDKKLVDPLID